MLNDALIEKSPFKIYHNAVQLHNRIFHRLKLGLGLFMQEKRKKEYEG